MNRELAALVLGTLLAVGALAFVLFPLFFDVPRRASIRRVANQDAGDSSAIRALREIEFDRATGKLSDSDYAELRRDYGNRAVNEMRASSAASVPSAAPNDPVEARVRAVRESHRECKTCGVRPERDAVYCSTCGSYLDGRCGACGRDVTESSAGFCSHCGAELGAAAN
jgi:hypothetical protein